MSLSVTHVQEYRSITLEDVVRGRSCDGCRLPLRLLSVKKSEKNNRTSVYTFRRGSSHAALTTPDYDRMFLCGDASGSGCCVIFTRSSDLTKVLIPEGSSVSVGQLIVAVEPRFVNQYLDEKQVTPVLRTVLPLFSLDDVDELPVIPIELQASSFVHFYLKNVKLDISSVRLMSSCGGSFCNRLYAPNSCGCIVKPSRPSFVLEGDIDIQQVDIGDDGDNDTGYECLNGTTINGLRFTKIFIDENVLSMASWKSLDLQLIKEACRSVLLQISGWNLSGWTKAGSETDDHLINEARSFHIVDAEPIYIDQVQAASAKYTAPVSVPIEGTVKGKN